jgi:hypothetical protein
MLTSEAWDDEGAQVLSKAGTLAVAAATLTLGACTFLPGDPGGPESAQREVDGRYELALGVCGDEEITRVQVYDYAKDDRDPARVRWDAKRTSEATLPGNVVVLGDDGTNGYLPDVPLEGALPSEMFVVITTSEDIVNTVVELSDFKAAEDQYWWQSGKRVRLSDVEHPRCS